MEQLARLTERLKKMEQERPPRRPKSFRPKHGRAAGRRFVVSSACLRRCASAASRLGIAVVLWRSGKTRHRLGGALCRLLVATGKAGVGRAAGTFRRSPRCGGSRHPCRQLRQLRQGRRTTHRRPSWPPSEQAQLLQTMARDLATMQQGIEAAQGKPGAIGQRECEDRGGVEGQPGSR